MWREGTYCGLVPCGAGPSIRVALFSALVPLLKALCFIYTC